MDWIWLSRSGVLLGAYLIGGIPTAYLATRFLRGDDIRQLGDRNSGAANVFRNVGPKAGLAVGVIDIVKGAVAVILAIAVLDSTRAEMVAGVLVVMGHNWPILLRFRGGRGAAPAVGVLLATVPLLAIPLGLASLVVLYFTKKATASLGFFLILLPFLAWWPMPYPYSLIGYVLFIPLLVGASHFISLKRVNLPAAELNRL